MKAVHRGFADDHRIAVGPVVSGRGKPSWGSMLEQQRWELRSMQSPRVGAVLRFEPVR